MKRLLLAGLLLCSLALAEDTIIPNVKYKNGNAKAVSAADGEIVLTKTEFIFRNKGIDLMKCPLTAIKEINGGVTMESPGLAQMVLAGNVATHRLGDLMVTLETEDERVECWYFRTTDSVDDAPRFLSILRVAVQRAQRLEAAAKAEKAK